MLLLNQIPNFKCIYYGIRLNVKSFIIILKSRFNQQVMVTATTFLPLHLPRFQVICLKHFTLSASHPLLFPTLSIQPSTYHFPVIHQYSLSQLNFKVAKKEQGVILAMKMGQEGWEVLWPNIGNSLQHKYHQNSDNLNVVCSRVWDVNTGEMLNTLIHHCEAVLHLRFNNGMMVTCSKDRSIAVWDMASPTDITLRRVLVGHRAAVNVV